MGEEIAIDHEQSGAEAGRYVARFDDGLEAELTYRVNADGPRMLLHAGTPVPLRGRGIAAALTARAVEDARADGVRIVPVCPYTVVWFKRHADARDVLAE